MTKSLRILRIIAVALLLALGGQALVDAAPRQKRKQKKPARTVENVRREQDTAHKRISETSDKINVNDAELKRRMGQLNSLNADIKTQTIEVSRLRSHVDSIKGEIQLTSDSIAVMEHELEGLRQSYAQAMSKIQPSAGNLNVINFIFASKSFSEAWSRLRYLRRFAEWRKGKAEEIEAAIDRIASHRRQLTGLRHSHDVARRNAEQQQHSLEAKQAESKKLVASLRKEDARLRRELKEQQQRSAALDRELDRLIAEEQARMEREEKERRQRELAQAKAKNQGAKAKPQAGKAHGTASKAEGPSSAEVASARAATKKAAETSPAALTGSFRNNKGKLLFPVSGSYKIVRGFGRQPHPTLKHVMVDNSGIDIETRRGSSARAIFAGTVSAIIQQPGYGWIVMLRHGSYLSVYAGLTAANVKKGQQVKAGQTLGVIAPDPLRDVAMLHFEVRNERTKLNPTVWVK
ncbi:MAG: peptidoglycan DD-metalloendopeptidase family protein [Muribaculaceae bacterium]|nr:peptidoglycan DD-metalloendopeptidase family protein [Muribaculaceae bacterium]